jgi:hypothetical protein
MLPNQLLLNTYVGRTIAEICPNHYANDADNHCAHFVSHAMGYGWGVTCLTLRGGPRRGSHFGANIRVHEIFPHCPTVGTWTSRPVTMMSCLVFITGASNVNLSTKMMDNAPSKHVGIYLSGLIYHYSNLQHRVIYETPDQFSHCFAAPDNTMFYGSLP